MIARHTDAGRPDLATSADGAGGCPWTVEELAHELPIAPPTSGKPAALRVAYDPLQDEIALLFKPRATDSSTRVLFQRFSAAGRALGDPIELQAELVPSRTGASWEHGLIGVVSLNDAWVALWSQVAYSFESGGYVFSDGAIVARRIVAGVAEDSPRTLLTTQSSHLRAHDLHWTGSTLAVAAVEDSGLWQSGLGQAIVQLYRFGPDLEQQGDAITIPEQDSAQPLVEVKSLCVRGDELRLGLSAVGWRAGQHNVTDRVFALIEGDRVTAVSSERISLDFHVLSTTTLAHGGGYFLSCTSIPPNCVLLDEQSADPVGAPLDLYSAALPRDTVWQADRFWVAESTGDAIPAQRLLGSIDVQGNLGHQRLSQELRTPMFASTTISTFLLRGKTPDELLWIDNTRFTDSSDGSVLLRLTRSCP